MKSILATCLLLLASAAASANGGLEPFGPAAVGKGGEGQGVGTGSQKWLVQK